MCIRERVVAAVPLVPVTYSHKCYITENFLITPETRLMSAGSIGNGGARNAPKGYFALIGSLAVLAVVLSPLTPMPERHDPGIDQVRLDCQSLTKDVEHLIAGDKSPQSPNGIPGPRLSDALPQLSQREMHASAVLMNEICSRPDLAETLTSSREPTVSLIAYGCEAAADTTGFDALPKSISEYQDIYCTAAFGTIESEIASWSDTVEKFFYENLQPAHDKFAADSNKTMLVGEAESILINASRSVQQAEEFLNSGQVYEAASLLDAGVAKFTSIKEREDMDFLYE